MQDYGNPSYWDERYSHESGKDYDWYQDYSTLKTALAPFLRKHIPDFEILIPGCGNSKLGSDLYDDGFTNITNIDISSVVISEMSDRYMDKEEMEFSQMDARRMELIPDDCFDLSIDKGLFDALLCGSDNLASIQALTQEMYRVLKPGGVYLIVSHGAPEQRMSYLTKGVRWAVESFAIPKPPVQGLAIEEGNNKYHYIYSCKKLQ